MNYIELRNDILDNLSTERILICNAYIKYINKRIEEQLEDDGVMEKLCEAIAKGLPYYIDKDMNIRTLTEEEFYEKTTKL